MEILKKVGFISLATFTSLEQSYASIDGGLGNVSQKLAGSQNDASQAGQNIISNILFYMGVIAVVYGLYGGFLIMTAGGDDSKVKQGKQILINVAIGIVIIILANSIVKWVMGVVSGV